jgi:pimeloyl-ACP methyl ester carboxylesterase
MRFSPALGALLLLGGCATTAAPPQRTSLHLEYFGEARTREVVTLIVVLHGDEAIPARSDTRAFAQSIVRAVPRSAVATILRSGFADAQGNRSPGQPGKGIGDGYESAQVDAIAHAIFQARDRYVQPRIILVGEGGGAALSANIAARISSLIDGIVLVGCPCSLPEWRTHMAKRTGDPAWARPVQSLDPLQTAGGVLPPLRAAVLVGADDTITPVAFSRSYAEALSLRGVATEFRIVPGRGHDLLGDPEVLAATARLAAALPRKPL